MPKEEFLSSTQELQKEFIPQTTELLKNYKKVLRAINGIIFEAEPELQENAKSVIEDIIIARHGIDGTFGTLTALLESIITADEALQQLEKHPEIQVLLRARRD